MQDTKPQLYNGPTVQITDYGRKDGAIRDERTGKRRTAPPYDLFRYRMQNLETGEIVLMRLSRVQEAVDGGHWQLLPEKDAPAAV